MTYTDVYSERGEKVGVIEYATKEDMEEAIYSLDGRELHRYRCKIYKVKFRLAREGGNTVTSEKLRCVCVRLVSG